MLSNDQLAQLDCEIFFHPSIHLAQHAQGDTPARVIKGGEGVYIVDRDDRKMLDAFAWLYCVNVGYGRTEIARAMPQGDIIGFAPRLCITPGEVDIVVSVTKEAVSEVFG